MKVYVLTSDVGSVSSFVESPGPGFTNILSRSIQQKWRPFSGEYAPVQFDLDPGDDGKKNYQFDISGATRPFFVFSEQLYRALVDIFSPRGQLLSIVTPSKRRKFVGYFPTNPIDGCLDLDKSIFETWPNGLLIRKYVLRADKISDSYLFSASEGTAVFVTDRFRERIESEGFKGFSFEKEIELS